MLVNNNDKYDDDDDDDLSNEQCTSRGKYFFLFATPSRPALWPTHPPIKWVPVILSRGIKRPGRETDN
jgi:hypothetical protein